ncbi:MAG: DUF1592 domain-containing protein, partial [Lentisphaeraceae bacterium]|nr:DUF1592 domain-containing protein [Lentisphaeraceae bacterium]
MSKFNLIIVLCFLASILDATQLSPLSKKFIEKHCSDCHDEDVQKGDVRLDNLSFNFTDKENISIWTNVFDAVSQGNMPPKKKKRPSEIEKAQFLKNIETSLISFEKSLKVSHTRIRRLNRQEFETTLSDLLETKLNIVDLLPEDAQSHGFDTVGDVLNVSSVQIESYLRAIDVALDQATYLYDKPARKEYNLSFLHSRTLMERDRKSMTAYADKDGMVFFSPQRLAGLSPVINCYSVAYPGKYIVKVKAEAVRSTKPLTLLVRMGDQGYSEGDKVPKTILGYVDVIPGKTQEFSFEGDFIRGQYFRAYPVTLPFLKMGGSFKGKQDTFLGPGIKVKDVKISGPIYKTWPPKSHKVLWGNTRLRKLKDVKPHLDHNKHLEFPPKLIAKPKMTRGKKVLGRIKNYYDPKQKWGGEAIYPDVRTPKDLHPIYEFAPSDSKKEATELIQRFLIKAFRREVRESESGFYVALVHGWLEQGIPFERAMKAGYKAILTSPDFLYLKSSLVKDKENGDTFLTDQALAERLAYLLWSSSPDKELDGLVKNKKINQSKVLDEQVERMLRDSRSNNFFKNFVGQWLDLRKIDFTSPDKHLYPEFNSFMKWSMTEESMAFLKELIHKDLSLLNVVDSDFVMINEELAKLYEIPGVKGPHIRRVKLPKDSVRGGVMTMGSVLKVTANGSTTSPIVRGVWILERIMGIHPPPPPSEVPAIEPDLNGAETV